MEHIILFTLQGHQNTNNHCYFLDKNIQFTTDYELLTVTKEVYQTTVFTFMLPCIIIDFFLSNQPDALIIQIYSIIKLYMFRASSLPIIRSSPL